MSVRPCAAIASGTTGCPRWDWGPELACYCRGAGGVSLCRVWNTWWPLELLTRMRVVGILVRPLAGACGNAQPTRTADTWMQLGFYYQLQLEY